MVRKRDFASIFITIWISFVLLIALYLYLNINFLSLINFAKIAVKISLPDQGVPYQLTDSGVDGNFVVLTKDNSLLLYSDEGTLLDSILVPDSLSKSTNKTIHFDKNLGIVLVLGREKDIYSYIVYKVEDNRIVKIETKKDNSFKYNYTSQIKNIGSENSISKNMDLKYFCLSVDIEYGRCFFSLNSIKVDGKYIFLKGKTFKDVFRINDSQSAIIIVSRVYDEKERSNSAELYIIGKNNTKKTDSSVDTN